MDIILEFIAIAFIQMLPVAGAFLTFFIICFSLGSVAVTVFGNREDKPEGFKHNLPVSDPNSVNSNAVISFILGFSAIIPEWGILLGLIAVVFGIIALYQIKNKKSKGEGFAFFGIGFAVLFILMQILVLATSS